MQEKLYDVSRAYNRALRWSDYDLAARYVPAPWVESFLDEHERLDHDIVIVDYELKRLRLDRQRGTAESRVEFSWHTEDRLVVETSVIAQAWQWYEGAWFLVDERLIAGEPVVFAPAVLDKEHPYLPGLERFRSTYSIGPEDDNDTRKAGSPSRSMDPRNRHLPGSRAPKT